LLEHLAADEGERYAGTLKITLAFQAITGDADTVRIEAESCEAASLGESQYVRPVLVTDTQDNRCVGAFDLPVPVMGMDQLSSACHLGLDDDPGTAVHRIEKCWAEGKLDQFGSRIDQENLFEADPGTRRDTAHFHDMGVVEILDDRQIGADDIRQPIVADIFRFDLRGIMGDCPGDLIAGLTTILDAALIGRS
jgi:hypothetical protein